MAQRVFDFDKNNVSKNNLGLAKKTRVQAEKKDAVENIGYANSIEEAAEIFKVMIAATGIIGKNNIEMKDSNYSCDKETVIGIDVADLRDDMTKEEVGVKATIRNWYPHIHITGFTIHLSAGTRSRLYDPIKLKIFNSKVLRDNIINMRSVEERRMSPIIQDKTDPNKMSFSILREITSIIAEVLTEKVKSMNESNLGLAKKTRAQAEKKDAVENVSIIAFEDPEVERICHEHGVFTYDDAARVTSIKEWFKDDGVIKTFNEFKYFTGLKSVEDHAFYYCTYLKSINIPDSVTSIGESTFWHCEALEFVNIPDSVTEIQRQAFAFCKTLQSINIPDSVTSIGGYAFDWCTSLQSINIPDSVTSIRGHVFYHCDSLQTINIPDSVTSIGIGAFWNCRSLRSITIPDSVTSIGKEAFLFFGCDSLQTIFISKNCPVYNQIKKEHPSIQLVEPTVNESDLGLAKKARHKAEGKDAVNNVSVILFEDPLVKEICNSHDIYTYEDAANVDSLYSVSNNRGLDLWFHGMPINKFNELKWFTGLKSIKASTFSYCSHLQEITLPEGITSIEANAFRGCESLKKIVVPEGVKYIYNHAFAECKTIEEIYLPSTLQKVGMSAFADINKDAIIRVPSGWNKDFIYLDKKKVVIDGVNESNLGLAKKTRSQVEGKDRLEGFLYVHSVDEAVECFKNAIKKTGILDKGITMDEIDHSNRGDLTKTSKAKLIKLKLSPDSDRFGLNVIIREWPDEEGFTLHCGGELKKTFKDEVLRDPLVSECIVNRKNLRGFLPLIGNQIDRNMMSVEVIKRAAKIAADILKRNCDLSESNLGLVKKISKNASEKDAINELMIDFKDPIVAKICHDNGIYTKEDAAAISYNDIVSDVYVHKFTFRDTKIETFDEFQYFTGLKAIPYAWFAGCNELKSIVIPDSLNYIGDFAFNKTNSLEKIIIPRTVERIARSAFSSSGIREVVFEEPTSSKIEIESSAFLHCDNLTEVTLPSGLKWMREEVFWQCKSLKDVWIPANSNIDYVHVSMFRKSCGNSEPEGDRVTIHIANKDLYLRLLNDIFEANIIKKEKVTIVYSGSEPLEESSLGLAKKITKDKEGKRVESVIEEMDIISYEEACSKLSFMQSSRDESADDFKYKYFDEAIINDNDLKVFVEVGVINDKDYGDFDFLVFSLYTFLGTSFVKDYIDWILPGAKVVSTEKISSIIQNTSSLPYVLSNTNLTKVRDAIEDMKSRGQLYFEALKRKEKPQAYRLDGSNEKGVTKDDIIDCLEEVFKDYITKDPYDYGVRMIENNSLVSENKEKKLTPGMILEADKGNICEAIKETSGLEAKLRFDKEDGLIKNIRLVVEKDNHKYHRDIKLDEILENASIEKPEELWMSPNDVEVNEAIAKAASSLIGSRPRK